MFEQAKSTAKLSQAVIKLEAQVKKWANSADKDARRQWRLSRGELAKAKYKLAERLGKSRPFLAVQLYYHSLMLGNMSAGRKLFENEAPCSSQAELSPGDIEKSPGYLLIIGLQAISGIGMRQNDAKAFAYFSAAAGRGHAGAQNNLGWMYQMGRGVTQDGAQALAWFLKAAEQGNASAQYNLGWIYHKGHGVTQEDEQAVDWFSKAAEQGYASAQYKLGWMYHKDCGVAQDEAQAFAWYRKAAEQGDASTQYNLGRMYDLRDGVQYDAQAVAWYRKAAEQGHADAQRHLGCTYDVGSQALPIIASAAIDYRKDYAHGVKEALIALEQCANLGSFEGRYHHAMALSLTEQRSLLEEAPDAFSKMLLQDDLLSRDKRFFLTYLVANHQYARLAHVKDPQERQQRIDDLIQRYGIFTKEFEHYAEIQLVLAHLHYLNKNEKWEACFNTALKYDHDEEVIGWLNPHLQRFSWNNGKQEIGRYLKAKACFFKAKQENKQELMTEHRSTMDDLRLHAITQFSKNNSHHMAQIKLTLMDIDDDVLLQDRLLTLKQIDPTLEATQNRHQWLFKCGVISQVDLNTLRIMSARVLASSAPSCR